MTDDWALLLGWIAIGVSVLALFTAGFAAWFTRKEANATQSQTDISRDALALARGDAASNLIRWRITRLSKGVCALEQMGDGVAYDVMVDPDDPGPFITCKGRGRMAHAEGLEFTAISTLSGGGYTVRVTWRSPDHQERHVRLMTLPS